jgi:sigma-B regulation protein RsbU (phosphoserine phosphatase)
VRLVSPERADGYYEALVEDDPEELYETAPCGYVSTSPTGIITKANRTFLDWTGYHADELFHERRIQSLLPVGDRIFYETHFAPSLSLQGSVREIAVEVVCASGARLPVLLNAVAKLDGRGDPTAIRIAVFDARERRSYERELVAARQAAERAADEARALAETLQATFLPLTPPSIPGLDIGGAYRPAGDGRVVGGDFYDVFETGPERWGVVLGDVCGKGASAAVVTALSRHTVRSAAARTRSPSAVLRELHDELVRSDGRSFCTALYATVEIDDRGHAGLVLSAGGHHLPLLVRRDGSVEERGETGALLGMLGPPRLHNSRIDLAPGEALVLFTDGVVEARDGDDFFGEDRLRARLAATRGRTAQEIADTVAGAAVAHQHGHARDDIAVVVLRVP